MINKKTKFSSLNTLPAILTRVEVAKLLKVDLSTLHNWNKTGTLKASKVSGKVYYLKSDIEALFELVEICRHRARGPD